MSPVLLPDLPHHDLARVQDQVLSPKVDLTLLPLSLQTQACLA